MPINENSLNNVKNPPDIDINDIYQLKDTKLLSEWWATGNSDLLDENIIVFIDGMRASTNYGNKVAYDIGRLCAENNITIATTGAYGIASEALRGAFDADGKAIVFMAGGLSYFYPGGNTQLFHGILKNGLMVSPEKPYAHPTRERFAKRAENIVNATTHFILVEASIRSKAYEAAEYAIASWKPTGVVPGPITSVNSVGSNQLMQRHSSQIEILTDFQFMLDWIQST